MSGQTFYFYGGDHTHYYFSLVLKPKKGGSMVDQSEIESYELILPEIIGKIQFVGSSLINASYQSGVVPKDSFYLGSGIILIEAVKVLEEISQALYPDELEEDVKD